ncbi:type VII secretion target [Sciscionella marina]|uniref:type VII secretion target n=1 Tax=Sciscionella marina TaxID=508770 RepID=UPI000362D3A4|nr:type VII secretion target [Sciscionella marina]
MNDKGFHVDPDRLREHASSIAEVRARIQQVIDAGTEVTPGGWDNAYGLACQGFPIAVRANVQHHLDLIKRLDRVLGTSATKLEQNATDYAGQERRNKQELERVYEQRQRSQGRSSFHERLDGE